MDTTSTNAGGAAKKLQGVGPLHIERRRDGGARREDTAAGRPDERTEQPEPNGRDPNAALPPGVKRTWICAAHIVSEPLDWLWKGWLARGKLTIMAGDPGGGKSAV